MVPALRDHLESRKLSAKLAAMQSSPRSLVLSALLFSFSAACSSKQNPSDTGSGGGAGTTSQGGAVSSGGASSGTGGSSTATGGTSAGGASAGGASAGGASAGMSSGGATGPSGGMSSSGSGGSSAAGAAAGGVASGGTGGAAAGGCTKTADTLFCEDFEMPLLAAAKANGFNPVTNMGTLTADAVHARGTQALHVHTEGNGKAYIQVAPFAPPQNSFFGRMYVWATAFPTAPDYAHFTLVEAAGSPAGVIRPIGGQYIPGKGDLWGTGSDVGPTGDWTNWKESAPAQAGKWLCMEWEMTASNNAINVWIDGTAKPELSVSTKMHGGSNVDFVFPTFNNIWFGWWLYQSGSTPAQFDLWLDDIALSTKRVGCM